MERKITLARVTAILQQVLIVLLPFILFLYAAKGLSHWLVDDAGVSMSYARNLADGYGLVSQPGVTPVEGYSDPSWVLLLALLAKCGIVLPTAVKTVSYLFVLLIFFLLWVICKRLHYSYLAAFFPMVWLALQPSFVIWTVSGLENAIYGALILALVLLTIKDETKWNALLAGMLAGLLALTRPEGLVFLAAYLLFHRKYWYLFGGTFAMVFGSYFIFRLVYFGVPFANTYYMKMEGIYNLKDFLLQMYFKFRLLGNGLAGKVGFWIVAAAILVLIAAAIIKKFKPSTSQWLIFFFSTLGLGTYLVLPNDWMGELRFATAFIVFFPLLIALALHQVLGVNRFQERSKIAAIIYLIVFFNLILLTVTDFIPRIKKFSQEPTISFEDVTASALGFKHYADILRVTDFSILQADVGGALWVNQYRVIDLGGLVDPVIARTLGKDETAFRDYILAEQQPEMIDLHGKWAQRANLQADARFQDAYRPLYTYTEPSRKHDDGSEVISGFYVRKDVVKSEEDWQRLINYRERK